MNRSFKAALAALVVLAFGLAIAPPVQAAGGDSRACVTTSEYRAIKAGMSKGKVKRVLDGRGTRVSAKTRRYAKCSSAWKVRITYNKRYTAAKARVARKALIRPAAAKPASNKPYAPTGTYSCPKSAPIKGNESSMIYHPPSSPWYDATSPEECFASESAARAAGYRRAQY